jgi:hypothetical protein
VQKFQHRNIYDLFEKDVEANHEVHKDDYFSDNEHIVQEGADDEVRQNNQGGEATTIDRKLEELIRSKK